MSPVAGLGLMTVAHLGGELAMMMGGAVAIVDYGIGGAIILDGCADGGLVVLCEGRGGRREE